MIEVTYKDGKVEQYNCEFRENNNRFLILKPNENYCEYVNMDVIEKIVIL